MLNLKRALLSGFFLSGFAALIYEVVWTQLLTLAFGSSVYSFSIMLAAFFLGLGIGGYAAGRHIDKINDPIKIFSYLEMGIGLSGNLILLFYEKIGETLYFFYGISGSFYLFMASVFLLSFLFMVVPAALMGATLPVVSKIYADRKQSVGRDIGEVFSFNTFGAIFGSSFAGFIFIPYLGIVRTIVLAALINISVAFMIFRISKREGTSTFYVIFSAALVLILYMSSFTFHPLITGIYNIRNDPAGEFEKHFDDIRIVYYDSNAYGTVVVADEGKDRILWINNKVDASTTQIDMDTQLLLGYLPMFAHPDAKDVLNIGLGGGFTLGAIEAFNVSFIDVIELNPLVEKASLLFRSYNGNSLDDSRANLIIADARNYLLTSDKKYDVIISEPSNIWVSGESNLFTSEFYQQVKGRLNEGGVFCQWIPLYDLNEDDVKILFNTLDNVFPHVTLWIAGTDGIVVASMEPVMLDYEYMKKMVNHSTRIRKDLTFMGDGLRDIPEEYAEVISENNLPDTVIKTFSISDEEIMNYSEAASLNTDDHPVLEFNTARNFFFSDNKLDSVKGISIYSNINGKSIIPISKLEHQEGGWLYLDFMGLKINTDKWRRSFSGYRNMEKSSFMTGKSGYYRSANFTDGNNSFSIVVFRSSIRKYNGDTEKVAFIKNVQRRSELSDLMHGIFPFSEITEYKKNEHIAYRAMRNEGERKVGMLGWYCDVYDVFYLIDFQTDGGSGIDKINDNIFLIHN